MSEATAKVRVEEGAEAGSKGLLWTGRVLTVLTILFMLFDAFGKFAKPVQVTDAFSRLGLPISTATCIGILPYEHSALCDSADGSAGRGFDDGLSGWRDCDPDAGGYAVV